MQQGPAPGVAEGAAAVEAHGLGEPGRIDETVGNGPVADVTAAVDADAVLALQGRPGRLEIRHDPLRILPGRAVGIDGEPDDGVVGRADIRRPLPGEVAVARAAAAVDVVMGEVVDAAPHLEDEGELEPGGGDRPRLRRLHDLRARGVGGDVADDAFDALAAELIEPRRRLVVGVDDLDHRPSPSWSCATRGFARDMPLVDRGFVNVPGGAGGGSKCRQLLQDSRDRRQRPERPVELRGDAERTEGRDERREDRAGGGRLVAGRGAHGAERLQDPHERVGGDGERRLEADHGLATQHLVDRRKRRLRRAGGRARCRPGDDRSIVRQRTGDLAEAGDGLLDLRHLRRQPGGRDLADLIGDRRERRGDLAEPRNVHLDACDVDRQRRRDHRRGDRPGGNGGVS